MVKLTKEDLKAIVDEIWSRLSAKLTGKADKDHTHPAQTSVTGNAGTAAKLQTGRKIGNASFDGSADITLSQIGAAAASHGTHVTYSADTPKAAGTAAAGSAGAVARADHVHPAQTSVTGNAGTATKLQTARTINGRSFDGSANITTAYAYNLVFGSTGNAPRYSVFARTSNANATGNCGATLLVSGCGNFGGTLSGAWLIQLSNRGSAPTMSVTTLQANNTGTVTFGYYTSGSYFYFGVYVDYYTAGVSVTVLRNTDVNIANHHHSATAPSGWTAVTPRVLQDASSLPVVGSITLTKAGWTQDSTTKLYKQAKTITGLVAKHRVDLDIDYATEMDLPAAIRPVNNNGSFYAVTAEIPEKDITAQYTLILTK